MPDRDTQLLTDEEVAAIETWDHEEMCGDALHCDCGKAIRDRLCATVKQLRAERLEVQRALASSVLNDPTEDDDPPYSTTELVEGIRTLIRRKESLLTGVVTQKSQLEQLRAENERLKSDVVRFSALADKRHDELCAARRQRDDLAAKCAPYLEKLP